ncbi:MAG: tRNA (adenosine(37)-N6)-dimethylallyltransferase MiaA [Parachlamydiales bacterium]|nr:tRNA (adenosine(37)-N6)-dimethylallyltransferase MiaA [Parachlamydiales bacterium]
MKLSQYTVSDPDNLFKILFQPQKQKSSQRNRKSKVIVIGGPTGVGKTKLSLEIAKIVHGEIISADSMQVYRKMDIGTDKIDSSIRKKIPHHLIDLCNVDQSFNVVDFYREAHQACRDIIRREKVPIVVGGSGFYLHTFLFGPPQGPAADRQVREKLEKELSDMGSEVLYERLQILDPQYAKTITEHDRHKIVRALEIITLTGRPVSFFPKPQKIQTDIYDFRCWFLYRSKEALYSSVEKRCEEMIEHGFVEEVKNLLQEGLERNLSASQAIGYRQCIHYLQENSSFEDFLSSFKKASRHYIKRQFTWFKKEPNFRWLNIDHIDFSHVMEYILQDYEQS